MKALMLMLGLMMAGTLQAATTGNIAVKLVIVDRCQVDGTRASPTNLPVAECSAASTVQPKITPSTLKDAHTPTTQQWITVEW